MKKQGLSRKSYRFVPYLIIIFFLFLAAVYTGWIYTAVTNYSGVVPYVEKGEGMYSRYPIRNKKIEILPFTYDLIVESRDSLAVIKFKLGEVKQNPTAILLSLIRSVTDKEDISNILMNIGEDGYYQAKVICNKGKWNAEIVVELTGNKYIITQEIFIE
jgi:hypothetical protein